MDEWSLMAWLELDWYEERSLEPVWDSYESGEQE